MHALANRVNAASEVRSLQRQVSQSPFSSPRYSDCSTRSPLRYPCRPALVMFVTGLEAFAFGHDAIRQEWEFHYTDDAWRVVVSKKLGLCAHC